MELINSGIKSNWKANKFSYTFFEENYINHRFLIINQLHQTVNLI
ncbi:MAG: hypothetical protein TRG1_2708 [Flavobacteriaceae bacterium FS1-H7996/R]|nr:MAG: hypothetical protein TRG1_2708 [Flavobacteriaceae bacterium FS1-H7996/R]